MERSASKRFDALRLLKVLSDQCFSHLDGHSCIGKLLEHVSEVAPVQPFDC